MVVGVSKNDLLSYCAEEVRRNDRDRFLSALFAPVHLREHLYTLYAFNIEVSKTREIVNEPMLGAIRLQWWREAIEAIYEERPVRKHAVLTALKNTINICGLDKENFERLIDGRNLDLEDLPATNLVNFVKYADATSGSVIVLALQVLGVKIDEEIKRIAFDVGRAWAIVGTIRAMPYQLQRGRLMLPDDLIEQYGVDRRKVLDLKSPEELTAVIGRLSAEAKKHLVSARFNQQIVPRIAIPALLPAVLSDIYLQRLRRIKNNIFDKRLVDPPGIATIRLAVASICARY
ncbi:MAG: phytoene synthase [Rickettsiales bacterium]|nr:phytoene synthase [Rickettsiales bacterium]